MDDIEFRRGKWLMCTSAKRKRKMETRSHYLFSLVDKNTHTHNIHEPENSIRLNNRQMWAVCCVFFVCITCIIRHTWWLLFIWVEHFPSVDEYDFFCFFHSQAIFSIISSSLNGSMFDLFHFSVRGVFFCHSSEKIIMSSFKPITPYYDDNLSFCTIQLEHFE